MIPEFLEQILNTASVSGCEEENQKNVLAYMKDTTEAQTCDAVGNTFSFIHRDAPCQVLLSAHMDEIGFRVVQIKDEGMIKVQEAGGVYPALYAGAPMQILHETESGIVKVNACGTFSDDLLKNSDVKDRDLVLDIGAASREEAEKAVSVGDPVCADTAARELLGGRISSRALDDKAGVYVIAEAAKRAVQKGAACGIIVHTSTGEETTGRGAWFAGTLKPSCCIAVDVTWANDCPGGDPAKNGDIRLGKGPAVCLSGMVNRKMNALLKKTAAECGIPVQYEVAGGRTYTDGDTIMLTGSGVPTALVSVPLRYMHSSVEIADLKDIEQCIELIAEFLMRIDADFRYEPLEV